MSDPSSSPDARIENQDGAVRDVDDPAAQQDTVSGGAPDEPDTPRSNDADDGPESESEESGV